MRCYGTTQVAAEKIVGAKGLTAGAKAPVNSKNVTARLKSSPPESCDADLLTERC